MSNNLLFEGIVDVEIDYVPALAISNVGKVSISGAQEKIFAVKDSNTYRLAQEGEQSTYIIKPRPNNPALMNQSEMPQNEYLTMQIAAKVYGIETADVGIVRLKNRQLAYLVKRFDITDSGKLFQEDICSLLGRSAQTHGGDYKYKGSYVEIAEVLKNTLQTWRFEMPKFFALVIFNYLFANGDAHMKNFSVIRNLNGEYRLTPAYDLQNTSLHINDTDFALEGGLGLDIKETSEVFDSTNHPCAHDFRVFGRKCGLTEKQIDKTLELFRSKQTEVYDLCESSLLSKKCKRMYIRSYEERLARLNKRN